MNMQSIPLWVLSSGANIVFVAQSDLLRSTAYRSNIVIIPANATISISGATYSRNWAPFTSSPGTLKVGDNLQIEATTSANASTATTPTITIGGVAYIWTLTTAALVLDRVPNAVLAYDTANQLLASFVGTPMTTSTGVVTLLTDQVGSRNGTPTGSPVVGTGTIGNSAFIKFDGSNDSFAFTSLALGSGDHTQVYACGGLTLPSLGALFGRVATECGIQGIDNNGFYASSDSVAEVFMNVLYGITKGFHCLIFRKTGTSVECWMNGELRCTVTVAGTWTLDQLGKTLSASVRSSMGFGRGIIFNRAITDAEIAIVNADTQWAFPHGYFVDATLGNDSNLGWNDQAPCLTLPRTAKFRRGCAVRLKAGELWRGQELTFATAGQGGAVGFPFVVSSYGDIASLGKPEVRTSTLASGSWANTTGTEYSMTIATISGALAVWSEQIGVPETIKGRTGTSYTFADKVAIMPVGTAGSLPVGSYACTGTLLTVNLGGDPTGVYRVEVGSQTYNSVLLVSRGDGISISEPNIAFYDIRVRYCGGDGVDYISGTNPSIYRCEAFWCGSDGFSGAAVNIYEEDCVALRTGDTARRSSGSPGDAFSIHGGSTATRVRSVGLECSKAGIDDQDSCTSTNYAAYLRGNNHNVWNALDTGGGTSTFKWGLVEYTAADAVAIGAQFQGTMTAIMDHMTFVNQASSSGTTGVQSDTHATVVFTNSICSNFATRTTKNSDTPFTANHNLASIGSVYGTGTSAGSGDLLADPIFVDAANDDYHLGTGSPGIGVASDRGNIGAL